jgi:hypothetical protein
MLAIVLDQRSAAIELGIGAGDQVTLAPLTEQQTTDDGLGVTSTVRLRDR